MKCDRRSSCSWFFVLCSCAQVLQASRGAASESDQHVREQQAGLVRRGPAAQGRPTTAPSQAAAQEDSTSRRPRQRICCSSVAPSSRPNTRHVHQRRQQQLPRTAQARNLAQATVQQIASSEADSHAQAQLHLGQHRELTRSFKSRLLFRRKDIRF